MLSPETRRDATLLLDPIVAAMSFDADYPWSGRWAEAQAAFAVMGTIDVPEDTAQAQPLRTTDGQAIVVTDGLLENREELLRGLGWPVSPPRPLADSAIIAGAYEKWGEGLVDHLEGHWALAVWRPRERRLFCAVDACGFRPLYYRWTNEGFSFASTLRGLLAGPGERPGICESALLAEIFTLRIDFGETLYEGVRSLPAAHTLVLEPGRDPAVRRYWQAEPGYRVELPNHKAYVEAFQEKLDHAVAFALRTTGNVGVLLSGGLDSVAVTVSAARQLAAQGKRLQVIHNVPRVADPRQARLREHDESKWVRMLEPMLREVDFHYRQKEEKALPLSEWSAGFDLHQVPLRGLPTVRDEQNLTFFAERGITALINGLGGNYVVSLEALPSGYITELIFRGRWWRAWQEARGCRQLYGYAGRDIWHEVVRGPVARWRNRGRNPVGRSRRLLLRGLHPRFSDDTELMARLRAGQAGPVPLSEFSVKRRLAEIINGLIPQNVGLSAAVLSPHYRIASAAPLLSRSLNEFCLGVPVDEQIRDGRDRLLMRDALAGQVPEALRWRVTRGLPTPNFWGRFQANATAWPELLSELRESEAVAPMLNHEAMAGLLDRARDAKDYGAAVACSRLTQIGEFMRWRGRSTI